MAYLRSGVRSPVAPPNLGYHQMKRCQHEFQQNSSIPACMLCGVLRSVVEAQIQQAEYDRGFEDAMEDNRCLSTSMDYVLGYKKGCEV